MHLLPLLLLLSPALARVYAPQGAACNASDPSQQWTYTASTGALSSGSGQCLSAAAFPAPDGTRLTLAPCSSGSPAQAFALAANNLIVLAGQNTTCVNLAGYGTTPGTPVWLYGCLGAGYTCQGNCDWERPAAGPLLLRNSESGLCLADGVAPQVARPCAPGTASSALPFCNPALGFEARAADLVGRLPLDYKLALLMLPFPVGGVAALAYPPLDIAAFLWDFTAIHGISFFEPATYDNTLNYTSFPHAIAQAASWDLDLVARITAATAYEARAVSQKIYAASQGLVLQNLMAEGGALANSAFTPTWGRTCETYGEDPHLISTMGVAVTLALQNASSSGFLQVASMTRHLLGYHGATDLPNSGEEWVSPQWLVDQHLPAYQALMTTGAAEGVMCSCNSMRIGGGEGPAPGIPACVHPAFYHLLRSVWNSSAVMQADNEAIFPMWQDHHYFPSLEAAMAGFLGAGGAAVDSGGGVAIIAAVRAGLASGSIAQEAVDAAVRRTFVSRLRVGEFDHGNPSFPFAGPWDESRIDGAEHRALAREAAARTLVLLRNENATLPLDPARPPASIAVIGPWGNASDRLGNYGHCNDMAANYAATTSHTSTILEALLAEVGGSAAGVSVGYARGSDATAALPGGLAAASALAAQADLVVLALGLGCGVETESVDRAYLTLPPPQEQLLAAVAVSLRPGARLVLVTVSAGLLDLDEAAVHAWVSMGYPGEEAGTGLGDVLWGRISPSGRLPLTGYSNDYLAVAGPTADFNMVSNTTGVGRTYRFAQHIPEGLVKLHFGSGLSYATFSYSAAAAAFSQPSSVNVTVQLARTSGMAGARQVTQVYVAVPEVAGTVTPRLALQAYTVTVPLAAPEQPSLLSFSLPFPGAFYTTLLDGSRQVTGGNYSIWVGGHQPGDARGEQCSNVLEVALVLPASAVLPCPLPPSQ